MPTITSLHQTFEQHYIPIIENRAKFRFRSLDADARQEAIQDVTLASYVGFCRAAEKGVAWDGAAGDRTGLATPTSVASFAITSCSMGREALGTSITDALAPGTQRAGRVTISALPPHDEQESMPQFISGPASDPAVRVRQRIDWAAIARRCTPKERRTLGLLARGWKPSEIAAELGVSPARITALKRQIGEVARSLGYGPTSRSSRDFDPDDGAFGAAVAV
jgi:hypothetical protein